MRTDPAYCILYDSLYTVRSPASTVVTIRVSPDLGRALARAARGRRRTKSDVIREILERALSEGTPDSDPAQEARRQSLLVSGRASEREALAFVEQAGDPRGWRG